MIETVFRAFVIFQPFIWIWLLEDERTDVLFDESSFRWFSCLAFCFMAWVAMLEYSIGFYSSYLLILYAFFAWFGTWICMKAYYYPFKEAVAISFLVTYLNSWYWEGVLHLWAIQENGLNMNQLSQLLHLIPAAYFLIRWEFDIQESATLLMKGWAYAGLITFARMGRIWKYIPQIVPGFVFTDLNVYQINHGLMILNRAICFYYLIKAIVRWGMPKVDMNNV